MRDTLAASARQCKSPQRVLATIRGEKLLPGATLALVGGLTPRVIKGLDR